MKQKMKGSQVLTAYKTMYFLNISPYYTDFLFIQSLFKWLYIFLIVPF